MGTAYNDQWVLKRVAAKTSMEPGSVETARKITARGLEGSSVSSSSRSVRSGMHRKPRAEQIAHHVKEEEEKMFPRAKKGKVDTARLGVQMEKRRSELKKELGLSDPDETEDDEGEANKVSPKKRRA